jgi:Protein of unknown function (DUF3348).
VRLLARIAGTEPPPTGQPLSAWLGQQIDWNRAVALSGALDGRVPAPPEDAPAFDAAEDEACARLRASLAESITGDAGPEAPADEAAPLDYAPFRSHYQARQRAMLAATGRLRGQLRDMLAASPALARLAEVDAVMEQVLSPREHALLAKLPALLGGHFERLQQGAVAAGGGRAWLQVFRRDMQDVLLAELDIRFQPIDALLAALRTPRTP